MCHSLYRSREESGARPSSFSAVFLSSLPFPRALLAFLALILFTSCLGSSPPSGHPTPPAEHNLSLQTLSGLSLTVETHGRYHIQTAIPNWAFGGDLAQPLSHLTLIHSSDSLGPYQEISFSYQGTMRSGSIRAYETQPIVLFRDTYLRSAPNRAPFPRLDTYPHTAYHLGYSGRFAQYSFQTFDADSPRLYFDNAANAFLLSPADSFMLSQILRQHDGSLLSTINPLIRTLPANSTHTTLLVATRGINATFDLWGQALRALYHKQPVPNDSSLLLNTLGYWTDRGTSYYYTFDPHRGYTNTLLAIRDAFRLLGIPLGYMQLDSWWYPKGASRSWRGDSNPLQERGGISTYTADPTLFPHGLLAFQQQLGLSLITHARWIDASSPYRQEFSFSQNVITDPRYWQQIAVYLKAQGVVTYEQDWLDARALPALSPSDPSLFLSAMSTAMAQQGLDIQYCMPLPRHFLQSLLYQNVTTIRTSDDRFQHNYWSNFLYTSRLASSLGLWPWSDAFMSKETWNLLLSTLSAGPVGVGDALGTLNKANLLQTMRADGTLIKPDVPIVPIDQAYLNAAQHLASPLTAATYTDHRGLKALYIFSYKLGKPSTISLTPSSLGISSASYAYNYFSGLGRIIGAGETSTEAIPESNYTIVVPIGPSGIAFLGDTSKFVSLGKKRITEMSDSGILQATIAFAASERSLQISGYAPSFPHIHATVGQILQILYNRTTHLFHCRLSPGLDGTATITISSH